MARAVKLLERWRGLFVKLSTTEPEKMEESAFAAVLVEVVDLDDETNDFLNHRPAGVA
jgi:hypothetical protein